MAELRARPAADLPGGITVLAHDLRSPLSVIVGACVALRRGAGDQRTGGLVACIEREVARIADRLAQADPHGGGAPPADPAGRRLDLAALVADTAHRFATAGRAEGVRITAVLAATPLVVRADAPAIERVVENLVANAVRHAGAGGGVTVEAGTWRGDAVVRVVDDGPGVPPADRERIFAAGVSGPGGGWGLGLAIARALARANGGDLTAEPCATGAAFRLTLPLRTGLAAAARGEAA